MPRKTRRTRARASTRRSRSQKRKNYASNCRSCARTGFNSARSANRNGSNNIRAAWRSFEQLQNEVDRAWAKLRADIRSNANTQTLNKDKNRLMLLLGECNYMARECARISNRVR